MITRSTWNKILAYASYALKYWNYLHEFGTMVFSYFFYLFLHINGYTAKMLYCYAMIIKVKDKNGDAFAAGGEEW